MNKTELFRILLTCMYLVIGVGCLKDNNIVLGGFFMLCTGMSIEKFFEIIEEDEDDQQR